MTKMIQKMLHKGIAMTLVTCLSISTLSFVHAEPTVSAEQANALQNLKFRKALTIALDKESLLKELQQWQTPATGFIPNGVTLSDGRDFRKAAGNYDLNTRGNVTLAKQLLAEAGYPDGKGVPSYVLLYNTSEGHRLIAENIQKQWKEKLNITITFKNEEWATFQDTRNTGNFDIARAGWLGDFNDPMTYLELLTASSAQNPGKWHNAEFNQLIEKSKTATGKKRDQLLLEAEKIMMTEYPILPLYYYTVPYQIKTTVKGAQMDILSTWYFGQTTAPNSKLAFSIPYEVRTLDPGLVSSKSDINVVNNLFEGLMRIENGKVKPAVAESYTVSSDLKTYTFKIRKNAKWSDGKPVTANDFEYAWKRNLNPNTTSEYSFLLWSIAGAQSYAEGKSGASSVGIKAINPQTLQVKLVQPVPYFTELTTNSVYMPLRKDVVEKDENWHMTASKAISNGPFQLKEDSYGSTVSMVANKHYWNAKSNKLKTLNFIAYPDEKSALSAYQSGQIQLNTFIDPSEYTKLSKSDKTFKIAPYSGVYYYIFNLK